MLKTFDSEEGNSAHLAQLVERQTFNLVAVGSSPTVGTTLSVWRNWIAHQTSNLGVAGSSPVMDISVSFPESGQRGAT